MTDRSNTNARSATSGQLWCAGALAVLCFAVIFHTPGHVALFEPDEGRNAEIGREILQLHDWITPHYDFIPYLDKPMGLYWLIAAAFATFGVSEWAARLPSALAALGCVLLVFDFARSRAGATAALWSSLILVSSPLFAVFSRASIFDMPLTFFVTLSVWAGARAIEAPRDVRGRWLVTMSAAMACATLVKGPVGVALPSAIIAIHAVATRRVASLRHPGLVAGASIFALLVVPWYAAAEWRNPGYLRYFLLEENVARFLTPRFQREGPWYYYAGVLGAGCLPWSPLFALVAMRVKAAMTDEGQRLLYLWAAVPVLAFSLSESKLPGYILPSLPPLAMLMGDAIARRFDEPRPAKWPLAAVASCLFVVVLAATIGAARPEFFSSSALGDSASVVLPAIRAVAAPLIPFVLIVLAVGVGVSLRAGAVGQYLAVAAGLAAVYLLAVLFEPPIAETRSSRELAQRIAGIMQAGDQLVIYDGYFSSLPFYLRIDRPIWNVWFGRRGEVLGSPYVAEKRPAMAAGDRLAWMTGGELQELWRHSDRHLLILVDPARMPGLTATVGAAPHVLFQTPTAALVIKP